MIVSLVIELVRALFGAQEQHSSACQYAGLSVCISAWVSTSSDQSTTAMSEVGYALPSCPINTDMPATPSLIPSQLLSEFNSVVLRVFEAIDDGTSR